MKLRILIVTSEWPSPGQNGNVPFLIEQVSRLRMAGVSVEVFSFRGRANPFRYAAAWWRLRLTHRLADFDAVHAHFGQSGVVALPCPVPLIVTFHGSDLYGLPSSRWRRRVAGTLLQKISKDVARRADRVIVVAANMKKQLPKGVLSEVIPCGIDLDHFLPADQSKARQQLGLPTDKRLVLFVGNPAHPTKRYELARAAVETIDPRLDTLLVSLFGEPHDRVRLYLNACDVLLLTSIHEGSPTIVKEALACGLPVASTPVGDVEELISGLPECALLKADSPSEIARELTRILSLGARVERGRERVQHLDLSVINERLVNFYNDIGVESAAGVG